MQLNGYGGYVVVLFETRIFSAGWVFLLQLPDVIANCLETAAAKEVSQTLPIIAVERIFPGEKEAIGE